MYLSSFNKIIIILAIIFLFAGTANADKRSYVWTYEYLTVEPGKWEVEYYNTLSSLDASHFRGNTTNTHQLELEVGMTRHFDFAVYQVFSQTPGNGLAYEGMKLRARYKFGEKGDFFLDPLLYVEYIGSADFFEHGIEAKLILARDFGNFNMSLNPIFEFEKSGAKEWEFKPGYALGISFAASHLLNFGIESTGSKDGIYLGPTITHGLHSTWVGISPMFAINKVELGKPEFFLRMIVAFGS